MGDLKQQCFDYTDDATDKTISHSNGLCAVCQKLDYISFTIAQCGISHHDRHYHIGVLEDLVQKGFCPSCRLIVSLVNSCGVAIESQKSIMIKPEVPGIYNTTNHFTMTSNDTALRSLIHTESAMKVVITADERETRAGSIIMKHQLQNMELTAHGPTGSKRSTTMVASVDSGDTCTPENSFRGLVVSERINIQQIKQWLHLCNKRHHECPTSCNHKGNNEVIRLVDVHERRVVSASLQQDYLALSYVWGSTTRQC